MATPAVGDFLYSAVDSRTLSLAVRANGQWRNVTTGAWETPYDPTKHSIACKADAQFPAIQEATVPASMLGGNAVVQVFANGAPVDVVLVPQAYLTLYPVAGVGQRA